MAIRTTLFVLACVLASLGSGCSSNKAERAGTDDTPTEAYKRLFNAVKSKDAAAIKLEMSRRTLELARSQAKQWGKTEDAVLENGMTMSTAAENPPPVRDERVNETMGAVEVWNSKDSKWEDLPFILEDAKWKLALGDLFGGAFKWPGKGRNTLDKEASNSLTNIPNVNTRPGNER
ncbi:MAG TPA: hypothetical protein VL501_04330 [Pyrinomonadaceae bacterium]|nr:hypothetical protein [Pyrinomonadaceae bacterium]